MKKRRPIKIKQSGVSTKLSLVFVCASLIVFTAFIFRPHHPSSAGAADSIKIVQDFDIILLPTPLRSVSIGEKIENVPVVISKWPKNSINDNYLSNVADYKNYLVTQTLPANMPIPISALSKDSENLSNEDLQIPSGMRAITVQLDSESALNGLVQTGSLVDVILIQKSGEKNSMLESKVIAESIKVISIVKSDDSNRSYNLGKHICTLLVSQEDALKIKTATQIGQITFMLRGSNDESPLDSYGVQQSSFSNSTEAGLQNTHKGIFRSSDGKVYYLTEDGRWLRKIDNASLRDEQISRFIDG